ncbi:queuosine precursor transporter [Sphingorhabdus sp.]|uniref:queuosine precursor transporter n=1 Tax=Sphingorhabdus sp. TaxID=1902408 RepID=UPI0032B82069
MTDNKQAGMSIPQSLFLFSIFYGGMVTIAGVLGAKQVALGPLAVEAGIFPFLLLVGISSGIAELHGKDTANRLVRFGFLPLIGAILLSLIVLQLPHDKDMYPPAIEAFPVILGQSWRMMLAGIISYGTSQTLNVWLFDRLRSATGKYAAVRGVIAAVLSQIVDTLLFISISFYGVRPIADLMAGQMLTKVVLSFVLIPIVIAIVVNLGRKLDGRSATA